MTPEEFELKMQTLITINGSDTEKLHYEMDELMCDLLSELGYDKGVEVFQNTEKWYA